VGEEPGHGLDQEHDDVDPEHRAPHAALCGRNLADRAALVHGWILDQIEHTTIQIETEELKQIVTRGNGPEARARHEH
jgi:hypothetical protein